MGDITQLAFTTHTYRNAELRTFFLPAHLQFQCLFNPLNAELNPNCCLLGLLGAHHFLHISSLRVKSLTPRLLMFIYIYI